MLALVKKPHIELSMHGEQLAELVSWIRKKYELDILVEEDGDELVSIESTGYWREMGKNRIGNLLAGARLKAGLTQAQLADRLKVRQNMISDYERGQRILSPGMAQRFSQALDVREELLIYGSGEE